MTTYIMDKSTGIQTGT